MSGDRTGVRVCRVRRTPPITISRLFSRAPLGRTLAQAVGVIWFFERESALTVCEIRRAADNDETFEFEVADDEGPKTQRFESAGELIAAYLGEQSRLMAAGWHPRSIATLD